LKKFALPLLILGLFVVLSGCKKPPAEEMEAAEAAVTRAENDPDAAAYAESSLNRARDAVSRMRTEANAKRYDAAKSYANEAIAAAEKAVSDGRATAARTQEEAAALVSSLTDRVTETGESLENAKKVPRVQLDFPGLDRDFDTARGDVAQAEAANNANRPREALEKGRTARAALSDIQSRINDGVRAASQKK
jgi:vacuolar-type H+-ATPase subunit I/STV1